MAVCKEASAGGSAEDGSTTDCCSDVSRREERNAN